MGRVLGAAAALAFLLAFLLVGADSNDARQKLIGYLDGIAQARLALRKQAVAQIQTRAAAEKRKAALREKIVQLMGGLPERRGAVTVKEFGTVSGDGFRVEKIAYESLPGFWVTANVYVPAAGSGSFPAMMIAPGHGPGGKLEDWNWGGNLARNGIMVLAYDPLGQGERLQYFDAEKKASKVGNPTGEHGEANIGPMLIGDDVARYMVNDAMRGVDYLTGRKDVDAARIGAFGCSGGGTATAYLAALDDRIKVAASACYITSFEQLLSSPTGVQDAEQTIPHFIEQGMDLADWVELFAPKPYAIVSTAHDMFPFEGARESFEEAKRIFAVYGAGERIQWITGPGGHGNLGPIATQIIGFFTKNLKGSSAEPSYTQMKLERREDLQCTPTGQVATSLGGETVYSLNRKRAEGLMAAQRALTNKADLERLQTRVRRDIRTLTGAAVEPGAARPVVDVKSTEQRAGYKVETIAMHSDGDTEVGGLVAIPEGAAKGAVLLLDPRPEELERLAKAGSLVMMIEPRPTPAGTESIKSPYLGIYNLLSLRAFVVGKTIVGLRTDDAIRAVDWLHVRGGAAITVDGSGALGMVALHAAALDSRIGRVEVENMLASYRMIVEQPLHKDVSEVVIPGVLRKYDTGDLLLAAYPRPVTVVEPRDAMGTVVSEQEFRAALGYAFASDKNLGTPERIRLTTK